MPSHMKMRKKPHMRNPERYWRERVATVAITIGVFVACMAGPVAIIMGAEATKSPKTPEKAEVATPAKEEKTEILGAPIYDAPAQEEPAPAIESEGQENDAAVVDETPAEEPMSYETGVQSVLTPAAGVNYFNGNRETWYSQRVLPGYGLRIPGRWVADDGTVRDGEGYICVASDNYPKGTVIETSLGTGKVYDAVGGDPTGNTVDIYTNW